MSSEAQLHEAVCDYIRLQYPDVLFNSDMSGVKLTMGQAIKAKKLRSSKGFPDLVIYEPRNGKHGLFLELKRKGEQLFKKDGSFKTEHLKDQSEVIAKLNRTNYVALFVIGFEEAKYIIDKYLCGKIFEMVT